MNFQSISTEIQNAGARLVAVSKTKPNSSIMALYNKGQRDFGENRVQELTSKYESLPKDICWHMIGRLQRNKVKFIVPFIKCIHSVDSMELLIEIEKQAAKIDRTVDCLLQFHIASESTKTGFDPEDASQWHPEKFTGFKHIRFCGVMGMATFTDDETQVRSEFSKLRQTFELLKSGIFQDQATFKEISMGMSDDYQIALEEGSTMVRIGTLLFGER